MRSYQGKSTTSLVEIREYAGGLRTMTNKIFFRLSWRRRKAVVALAGCIIGCITQGVYADEESLQSQVIKLSVRTIQASDPGKSTHESALGEAAPRNIHLDNSLRDLEPRLRHLPFNSFRLLAQKNEVITLKSRESLQLPNGQSLMFRPIYLEAKNKKMGLWLSWKDKDGSEILNTRVHFDAQESVLTGTDCSHDEGLILAIQALELERPNPVHPKAISE